MKIINKLKAISEAVRLKSPVGAGISVLFGQWLVYEAIAWPSGRTVLGALMAFNFIAFGNISNDLLDAEADSISHPDRPLIAGALSRAEIIVFSILFGGLTLVLGLSDSVQMMLLGLTGLLVVFLYNLYLKRVLFLANLMIGFWAILPLSTIAFISGEWNWKIAVSIAGLYLLFLGNEVIAGIPDVEGDTNTGRTTIASAFGKKKALIFGGALVLASLPVINTALFLLEKPVWFFLTYWVFLLPSILLIGIRLLSANSDVEISKVRLQNWRIPFAYSIVFFVLIIST
ncbi:MAG: hypothetical protein FVQ83_05320 [Chloroflexi bacterium]|nr:hypothetical protein [Chloroflexota bacterium]